MTTYKMYPFNSQFFEAVKREKEMYLIFLQNRLHMFIHINFDIIQDMQLYLLFLSIFF